MDRWTDGYFDGRIEWRLIGPAKRKPYGGPEGQFVDRHDIVNVLTRIPDVIPGFVNVPTRIPARIPDRTYPPGSRPRTGSGCLRPEIVKDIIHVVYTWWIRIPSGIRCRARQWFDLLGHHKARTEVRKDGRKERTDRQIEWQMDELKMGHTDRRKVRQTNGWRDGRRDEKWMEGQTNGKIDGRTEVLTVR